MRNKIRDEVVKATAWTKDLTKVIDDILKIVEQNQINKIAIQVHGEKLNKEKFEELARPMIKYLCEEFHPHVTVIITPTSAELLSSLKTIGRIEDYIRD